MRTMILAACAIAAIATPALSFAKSHGCETLAGRHEVAACGHAYVRSHARVTPAIYRPGQSARCGWHDRTFRNPDGRLMHQQVQVCR